MVAVADSLEAEVVAVEEEDSKMLYEPIPSLKTPELDILKLKEVLTNKCLQYYVYVREVLLDVYVTDTELRQHLNTFVDNFIVVGDSPYVKPDAVDKLIDFLLANISVLTENVFQATAELAAQSDESELYFYLPIVEEIKSNFKSTDSTNSNEYMLKLTSTFLKPGTTFHIINDHSLRLEELEEIRIVDDAVYSGTQLELALVPLLEKVKHPITVRVFLGAITEYAKQKLQQLTHRYPNLNLEINHVHIIPSLEEIVKKSSLAESFFVAQVVNANFLKYLGNGRSVQDGLKENIKTTLETITLTRTAFRLPDVLSFPIEIGSVFAHDRYLRSYPNVPKFNVSNNYLA